MYQIKKLLLLIYLLLPLRYNFYKRKNKNNTSVQSAKPYVQAAPHNLGEITDISDWTGLKYTLHLIFWLEKQVIMTGLVFISYIFVR